MTDAQTRALEQHWPLYGIDPEEKQLDLESVFQRTAPRILDVGSGMGETLIKFAERYPENDYLSVEVHKPGVGKLIATAKMKQLLNIRVLNHDVMDVLQYQLPDKSLDEVYILFPDPWPKKRHHKRRLVNSDFIKLLLTKLKLHARIFLATDWEDLADHMIEVCDGSEGLLNLAGQGHFSPRPAWRPLTKFENRGIKLGHNVWDLCYGVNRQE